MACLVHACQVHVCWVRAGTGSDHKRTEMIKIGNFSSSTTMQHSNSYIPYLITKHNLLLLFLKY